MQQRLKHVTEEASLPERRLGSESNRPDTMLEAGNSVETPSAHPEADLARPRNGIGNSLAAQITPETNPEADSSSQDLVEAVPLIAAFCTALEEADILYCHWKSNAALDRSATGRNDLDLLICRADRGRFSALVAKLGFQEATHHGEAFLPGVLSYYGFDPSAERLIHIHAHYQLILGQDRTKNYHIPIEDAFLGSRSKAGIFYVPTPEFEFVVFVLRMMLKFGTWDAVLSRQAHLPKAARGELVYLLERIAWSEVRQLIQAHLPTISPPLFERCAQAIQHNITLYTALRSGRPLLKALEPFSRQNSLVDLWHKGWRRIENAYRRRRYGQTHKAHMSGGGTMIALIGGDGAGKSTAIEGLAQWLAKDFAIRQIHLGKPPRSVSTHLVRLSIRLTRLLKRRFRAAESSSVARNETTPALDFSQILMQFCIARDRYWAYVRARRFVNNGGIVIADRFPVPQIQIMEGAKIAALAGDRAEQPLFRWLARREEMYYSRFYPPELLAVLRLDPTTAVARKPEEPAEQVYRRSTAIWQADWTESPAQIIDASQSQADVLATLKEMVWRCL